MLLEDERGTVNLIVPPPVYERRRAEVRASPLVRAKGRLERREGTTNVLVSEVAELRRTQLDDVAPPGHSFFINLPIGIATAVATRRLIADRPGLGFGAGADILGAALITAGLMLGVYTILEVSENGWGSTQTLVLGGVSLALEMAFVVRQARIPNPLMPLRLFRSRNVGGQTQGS
jgi:hypothetical protein